jgi:hypothetical protein
MPKRRKAKQYSRSLSALQTSPGQSTKTQKRKVPVNKEDESSAHRVDEKTQTKRLRHLSAPSSQNNTAHRVEKEAPSEFSSKHSHSSQNMTVDWNYDDDDCNCGPHKWPSPVDAKQQSPIDLRLSKMKVITLEDPFQFINYDKPLHGEFVNTGHSGKFFCKFNYIQLQFNLFPILRLTLLKYAVECLIKLINSYNTTIIGAVTTQRDQSMHYVDYVILPSCT